MYSLEDLQGNMMGFPHTHLPLALLVWLMNNRRVHSAARQLQGRAPLQVQPVSSMGHLQLATKAHPAKRYAKLNAPAMPAMRGLLRLLYE
jgi:hypothetical protein